MFEVGKFYIHNNDSFPKKVLLCTAVGSRLALLEYGGTEYAVHLDLLKSDIKAGYKEYVEPKVTKLRRFVSKNGHSYDGYSVVLSELGNIGKVEFTITDGKLTNVEIVE